MSVLHKLDVAGSSPVARFLDHKVELIQRSAERGRSFFVLRTVPGTAPSLGIVLISRHSADRGKLGHMQHLVIAQERGPMKLRSLGSQLRRLAVSITQRLSVAAFARAFLIGCQAKVLRFWRLQPRSRETCASARSFTLRATRHVDVQTSVRMLAIRVLRGNWMCAFWRMAVT